MNYGPTSSVAATPLPSQQEIFQLLERVTAATNAIRDSHTCRDEVLKDAYFFRDLLRDCAEEKFTGLSTEAWLYCWSALLYFIETDDHIADHEDGGLTDDYQVFSRVRQKFPEMFDAYFRLRKK